jgi:predicted DNA-binding transcriptional regulator YafY
MERIVRLATVLHHAGKYGVPAPILLEVAGWADAADGISALNRDFKHLRTQGWQIDNVAETGTTARYRMTSVDTRLRVKLTPAQQTALRRAVLLADRDDLADRLGLAAGDKPADVGAAITSGGYDDALATVIRALRLGALLRFRYNGINRAVHPQSLQTQQTSWYLSGRQEADDRVKNFVVSRMSEVAADEPGTAERPEAAPHPGLHPMSWEIDPPVEVTLRAPAEYAPDVRRWLGTPRSETEANGEVEMVYRVTNRSALRARVYQLGPRVTVVGPDDVRQELVDELAAMAGE